MSKILSSEPGERGDQPAQGGPKTAYSFDGRWSWRKSYPQMWFRILLLALGTFAIGSDGFVIAGILPGIAHDLSIAIVLAGFLVTAFSLAYALGSPVLAALTCYVAHQRLLLVTLSVFILANVLAALATSFWLNSR